MNIYQPVIDIIKSGNKFLVASHSHPDGDGLGSTIAMAKAIEFFGKKAVMFNADAVPFNLKFLPFSDKIVRTLPAGEKFDVTFMIDCYQQKRIGGDVAKLPRGALGKVVLIDHHQVDSHDGDYSCIDPGAAATGEVVCRFFRAAGIKLTPELATSLLCTFVVDTGSFRYSNTTPALFREAADLLEAGASTWAISKALDESNPVSYIKLLQLVLKTFDRDGPVSWVVLTNQMLEEAGASVDVAEEFINFPRSILGTEVAILFRQSESSKPACGESVEGWKVSFRSRDSVDVRKVAMAFDGGGHTRAAGCTLDGSLAQVKERVFEEVRKYLNLKH